MCFKWMCKYVWRPVTVCTNPSVQDFSTDTKSFKKRFQAQYNVGDIVTYVLGDPDVRWFVRDVYESASGTFEYDIVELPYSLAPVLEEPIQTPTGALMDVNVLHRVHPALLVGI
jgi:hypothetical protein